MPEFVIYLIKSALLLAASVALFMLLMKRETFHRFNRWLLLSVVALSLIIPAAKFSLDSPMARFSAVVEQMVKGDNSYLYAPAIAFDFEEPYIEQGAIENLPVESSSLLQRISMLDTLEWVFFIYLFVAFLLALRLLYMYARVVAVLRSGTNEDATLYNINKNVRLVVHDANYKPFSWFGWVSISRTDLAECGREILTHELAHVECKHSYDILFADLVIILQWFNPMAWIMKSMLKDIHEYEADSAVLAAGVDAKSYQLLIIKKAVGARLYSIANSFNHSLTKKRITMMCKEKSSLWQCAKALYILPLAVVAACTFSSPQSATDGKDSENVANNEASASNLQEVVLNTDYMRHTSHDGSTLVPDVLPSFNGDFNKWANDVLGSLDKEITDAGLYYSLSLRFIVKKDGTVKPTNPKSVYEIGAPNGKQVDNLELLCDKYTSELSVAVDKLYATMPKFNPAMKDGSPVEYVVSLDVVPCKNKADDEPVYQVVEQLPEFVGGMSALMGYLSRNIKYPAESRGKNSQGKVFIGFVVRADGSIGNVEVVKTSGDNLLDAEAVRVVKAMPAWVPGKQGGKAVNVKYTLPVVFRLQGGSVPASPSMNVADDSKNSLPEAADVEYAKESNERVYQIVEQQPEFVGGMSALMGYLSKNIKYPDECAKNNIQGKAYVGFVVKKDGSITNVEVAKSSGNDLLDAEAVRVVKAMPAWIPGKQGGEAVNVKYTLPVMYRLK